MKKNLSFTLIAFIAGMTMTFFTSCKGKNQPTPPEPDNTPVAAGIAFHATFAQQTIDQCDISFDYYDENGNKKNEVVNTTEWSKVVKTTSLPATFGFHWNLAVKADLDTTMYEKFLVEYHFDYGSVALNAEGAAVTNEQGANFGNKMEMAMHKRQAVVDAIMNNNAINFLHKYDAEGKFTREDWK